MNRRPRFQGRLRLHVLITLAMVLLSLLIGVGGASAANRVKQSNHFITPSGVDLNESYNVSAQIIAPFCTRINQGRPWTVSAPWFMNSTFDAVPAGFIAAGATPFDDFKAKFVAVKYVIDPGTRQEQTVVFLNSHLLGTNVGTDGSIVANSISLGTLRPLRPGTHVVEVYWSFRAMHCDGFVASLDNCLPAGEILYDRIMFEVTSGQRR